MANTVEVDIVARLKRLENKLDSQAKKAGKDTAKQFGSSFQTAIGTFIGIGVFKALNAAIDGIKNQFGGVVRAAANLETIETQFKTILGSTKAAQKQLKDLQTFAASTPFQLEGLSTATRQLLSFGVAQESVIPTLRQLGDLAAGTGSQVEELAIPFGRLVSAQRITLEEINKFQDRGINLIGEFAKQTGKSVAQVRDDISKGRIPFEEFTNAIGNLTSKGGTFFGATVAQSKTLTGAISTLKDNFFDLQGAIGSAFRPALVAIVNKITVTIQGLATAVKDFASSPQRIKEVTFAIAEFGQAVIRFGVAPLEALFNAGKFVFQSIVVGINTLVSGFATLGTVISDVLDVVGVGSGVSEGIKQFAQSSSEVLNDSIKSLDQDAEGLFDFGLSDKLSTNVEDLKLFFEETIAIQNENGEIIRANNAALAENLTSTNVQAANGIGDLLTSISISFKTTQEQLNQTSKQIAQVVKNSLVKGISGGIQTIVNAVANGENAFKAFGNFVLTTIGDLAIKLGETLVFAGIGIESLKSLGGGAAIAAGAGLIALGAVIKSLVGGGGGAASPGGIGAQGDVQQTEDVALTANEDSIQERGPSNQIIVQGSIVDAQGVLAAINQVAEDEGGVLTGDFSFA